MAQRSATVSEWHSPVVPHTKAPRTPAEHVARGELFVRARQYDRALAEYAAALDGAGPFSYFFYIVMPHLSRAITVVILIETIFLLNVFAEIRVTTNGGPATTNLPFRIFELATNANDVGGAAAGGVVAVVLANIVAIFLMRIVGKNLEG